MTRRTGIAIAALAAAAVAIGLAVAFLPLLQWLTVMVDWVRGAGAVGIVVYAVVFIAVSLSLVPTSPLYVAAGVLYGAVWGTVVMTLLSVLASTATFGLARTVLRGWVSRRVARDARFAAIDAAIGAHGFSIAWLLRFSPILPFGALNYLLAATKMSLKAYLTSMVLGTLPGTIVLAYAGSLVERVGDARVHADSPSSQALLWIGIAATAIVTVILGQIGKHALDRKLGPR